MTNISGACAVKRGDSLVPNTTSEGLPDHWTVKQDANSHTSHVKKKVASSENIFCYEFFRFKISVTSSYIYMNGAVPLI